MEHNRFTSIHESVTGELWFGTTDGVTRLAHGTFTTYTSGHGLPHALVTGLTGDSSGTLWMLAETIVRWSGDGFQPVEEVAGIRFGASRWTPRCVPRIRRRDPIFPRHPGISRARDLPSWLAQAR